MTGLVIAAALAAATVQEIKCDGVYPWHLQGVASDGASVYWTFTTVLVKTDLAGKVQAKHEIEKGHMGDLCFKDGKVYVGMNMGVAGGCRVGDEVWEHDAADLRLLARHPTPEAVWCNNGVEFYSGSFWVITSAPHLSQYNMVLRYSPDFKFMRAQLIDSGWTNLGVQTICLYGDKMLFGCYGDMNDPVKPHPSCTLVVDGPALASQRRSAEFPAVVKCENRAKVSTAEGMVVIGGRLYRAQGIRLSPPTEKRNQRWTAKLVPADIP